MFSRVGCLPYSYASRLRFTFQFPCFRADKAMKDNIVKSTIVVALLFTMLCPENLVLNAVGEFTTVRESIRKHEKVDKDEFLSTSWFLSRHGWPLSLFTEQRIPSNMQHKNCLAVTPISRKVSVGLRDTGEFCFHSC